MKALVLGILLLISAGNVSAQANFDGGDQIGIGRGPGPGGGFPPGRGGPGPGPGGGHGGGRWGQICFYEHINFAGQSFCVNEGASSDNLVPSGWNDRISSISVSGNIGVTVYQDINYVGQSLYINQTVADIRSYGGQWNDFISSFSVDGGWHNPPPPPSRRGQVCFYENINYSGQSFCMSPGDQNANLVPSGWNDRISSIWVDGDASVYVYQDINYGGAYLWINQTIPH
ncbi:MAG: peptidase inhibitor family I36 protein, partial [Bdellovibrionales bacterium]